MAQSGYTPILIYASGTTGNTPSAANMTSSASGAELALNYFDGKLLYKDASGNVQVLASKAGNINVSSLSFGTTGLTPSTATTGAITVAGTLITTNGGTGLSSYTAGDLPYYASGTALSKLGIGTSGYFLSSSGTAPQWTQTLGVANGGTGLNSLTAGYIPYGNGTSAFASSSAFNYASGYLNIGTLRIGPDAGYNWIYQGGSGTVLGLTANGGAITFGQTSSEQMRINSAGNVGIGTSNPQSLLHVGSGNILLTNNYSLSQYDDGGVARTLIKTDSTGSVNHYGYHGASLLIGVNGATYLTGSTGNIVFQTGASNTEGMRLDTSQNLLVGETSNYNGGKVDIAGRIGAQGVGISIGVNNGSSLVQNYFGEYWYSGYISLPASGSATLWTMPTAFATQYFDIFIVADASSGARFSAWWQGTCSGYTVGFTQVQYTDVSGAINITGSANGSSGATVTLNSGIGVTTGFKIWVKLHNTQAAGFTSSYLTQN